MYNDELINRRALLENSWETLDKPLYVLRVGSINTGSNEHYAYSIYPVEYTVKEVRIGRALDNEAYNQYYGPGNITWLCQNKFGNYVQAFSPVGDEIISNQTIAGRQVRGFTDQEQLKQESEILKDLVFQTYKNVSRVEICLSDKPQVFYNKAPALADSIQQASSLSSTVNSDRHTEFKKPEKIR